MEQEKWHRPIRPREAAGDARFLRRWEEMGLKTQDQWGPPPLPPPESSLSAETDQTDQEPSHWDRRVGVGGIKGIGCRSLACSQTPGASSPLF